MKTISKVIEKKNLKQESNVNIRAFTFPVGKRTSK